MQRGRGQQIPRAVTLEGTRDEASFPDGRRQADEVQRPGRGHGGRPGPGRVQVSTTQPGHRHPDIRTDSPGERRQADGVQRPGRGHGGRPGPGRVQVSTTQPGHRHPDIRTKQIHLSNLEEELVDFLTAETAGLENIPQETELQSATDKMIMLEEKKITLKRKKLGIQRELLEIHRSMLSELQKIRKSLDSYGSLE